MIHDDPEEADFFDQPADESETAEKLTPGSINEERSKQEQSEKDSSHDADRGRFVDLERIDQLDEVRCPSKRGQ